VTDAEEVVAEDAMEERENP